MLGEGEAIELLAEVFDHVVALGFSVNEHVEAEALLNLDHSGDLALEEALVALVVEFSLAERAPGSANLRSLGKGADRCRGQLGQGAALALDRAPRVYRRRAVVVLRRQGPDALAHRGI